MAVVGGVGGCGVEAWRWWWCYVAEPASVGGLVISVATGVEWGGDGLLRHGAEICQWHPDGPSVQDEIQILSENIHVNVSVGTSMSMDQEDYKIWTTVM